MIPPQWPQRQNDLDIWVCEDCGSRFGMLADFEKPTFCPNCSSRQVRKADIPNDPSRPGRPNRPDWLQDFWM